MKEQNRRNIAYVDIPLQTQVMMSLYETNNIDFEMSELYYDFIVSLCGIIFESYLGDDLMTNKNKQEHFSWCWNKNINNFKEEGIKFTSTSKLYNYFQDFMFDSYYLNPEKTEKEELLIIKLWKYLFNFNQQKTRSDMDTVIELYKYLDEAIKNKK